MQKRKIDLACCAAARTRVPRGGSSTRTAGRHDRMLFGVLVSSEGTNDAPTGCSVGADDRQVADPRELAEVRPGGGASRVPQCGGVDSGAARATRFGPSE